MAEDKQIVLSNCLCYLFNKYHKIAAKPLKVLLSEFYSSEELAESKELLLCEVDTLKLANFPKISRRRRDSVSKPMLDIDDMFTTIAFLDENQLLAKCSTFVASSPDKMPATRLVEGDLEILWKKLLTLEEFVTELNNNWKHFVEITKNSNDKILWIDSELRTVSANVQRLAQSKSVNSFCQSSFRSTSGLGDYGGGMEMAKGGLSVGGPRSVLVEGAGVITGGLDGSGAVGSSLVVESRYLDIQTSLNAVNDFSNSMKDTRSWADRVMSSAQSESDIDSDNRPFTEATSRSAARRNKRKQLSANDPHNGYSMSGIKRPNTNGVERRPNNITITSQSQINNPRRSSMIVGSGSDFLSLKAATKPRADKAVFCVSNVSNDYTVDNIKQHCRDINIRVLFCFDISKPDGTARAFKLAVDAAHRDKMENTTASWPRRVVIRTWNYRSQIDPGLNDNNEYPPPRGAIQTAPSGQSEPVVNTGRDTSVHESTTVTVNTADYHTSDNDTMEHESTGDVIDVDHIASAISAIRKGSSMAVGDSEGERAGPSAETVVVNDCSSECVNTQSDCNKNGSN